jgi:hypothetical protein
MRGIEGRDRLKRVVVGRNLRIWENMGNRVGIRALNGV